MAVTISGVLRTASGVRPNTKIILRAAKTSGMVILYSPDMEIVTDGNGAYSFDCNPCIYTVQIQQPGHQRENVGVINIYADSANGALEGFLTNFEIDDLTPEVVKQIETWRNEAVGAAQHAVGSATDAHNSKLAAATSATESAASATESEASATRSSDEADKAAASVVSAQGEVDKAADSAAKAKVSETNAKASETTVAASAAAADASKTEATRQATAAAGSAATATSEAAKATTQAGVSKAEADRAKAEADRAVQVTGLDTVEEAVALALIDSPLYIPTEQEMQVMRASYANDFAASGFVHYGKHRQGVASVEPINEGMYSYFTTSASAGGVSNLLFMGRQGSSTHNGTSKTLPPVTCIAGFVSAILTNANTALTPAAHFIKFPPAPNGTVIYDSSGDCRGSGKATLDLTKDVDPKYGNVAPNLNEAVARAFEGSHCLNGDFRNGSDHWVVGSSSSVVNGQLVVASGGFARQDFISVELGAKYTFEVSCVNNTGGNVILSTSASSSNEFARLTPIGNGGRLSITVTMPTDRVWINAYGGTWDNFRLTKATEEVVINRVDLFGGEFFLEEITEAKPFVYDRGMVQSQSADINGVSTVPDNVRPATYFAVYDGDTSSVGKGVNWFTATAEQQKKILEADGINIWRMNDGRIVQWRMRQRTIAGIGNGAWGNLNPTVASLYFKSGIGGTSGYVVAQGQQDKPTAYLPGGAPAWTATYIHNSNKDSAKDHLGAFKVPDDNQSEGQPNSGVGGECYFHVWGIVPRLNQGAYHLSFNPMGAGKVRNKANNDWSFWYSSYAQTIASSSECFQWAGQTGSIGTASGRSYGELYDAIYSEGQGGVIDYRLSAYDMDDPEEAAKIFEKVGNGTYRGEQYLVQTKVIAALSAQAFYVNTGGKQFQLIDATPLISNLQKGDVIYAQNDKFILKGVATILGDKPTFDYTVVSGTPVGEYQSGYLVHESKTNIPVSGNFYQVDVLANPANVIATPALASGWLGKWIPKVTTIVSTFPLVRKSLVSGCARQYTINNGGSWTSDSPSLDTVRNEFPNTSTSGLVQVISYTAFAKQTKPSKNKKVLNGSKGLGYVWQYCFYSPEYGALLQESLTGKVPTNSASGTTKFSNLAMLDSVFERDTSLQKTLPQVHQALSLGAPNNNSPAVKALWYQTATNQQCSLNFAFNELKWSNESPTVYAGSTLTSAIPKYKRFYLAGKYVSGFFISNHGTGTYTFDQYMADGRISLDKDGNISNSSGVLYYADKPASGTWGDDSTIKITDGVGTYTNLNGEVCLAGAHELSIPYGYSRNQARAGGQVPGVDLRDPDTIPDTREAGVTDFHNLDDVPEEIKEFYYEEQIILSWTKGPGEPVEDPETGGIVTPEIDIPVYGVKLRMRPRPGENGGHISAEEIEAWEFLDRFHAWLEEKAEIDSYNQTPQYAECEEGHQVEIPFDKLPIPEKPTRELITMSF